MDAWVRKHQILILSSLYLVFSLLAAGYSVLYSTKKVYLDDLSVMSVRAQAVNEEMKKKIVASKKKEKQDNEGIGIRYLPIFLARINEIAHNNDVIIRRFSPDKEGILLKFDLDFTADYATFIRFTAELESLDILLDNIQVHPYDASKTPPLHAISFSLIPQNNAEPISGQRLDELKKMVSAENRRDPFQRFAYDASRKVVNPSIDLTWIYKLEGLGVMEDDQPYASINRKRFRVGDDLDGRTITSIGEDRVYLTKKDRNGVTEYELGFRKSDKSENKDNNVNKKK
ncbi:MAG: hypothetical protein HQL84_08595 [Magnetococcales bacterium]|nr:hypothetical protein [Magnetococcales bacterium]MBF0150088.1 hypothetical protein [Magnetococcales bacterium]